MSVSHQPTDHVAAHSSQTNHSKLHITFPLSNRDGGYAALRLRLYSLIVS